MCFDIRLQFTGIYVNAFGQVSVHNYEAQKWLHVYEYQIKQFAYVYACISSPYFCIIQSIAYT